MFNISMLKRVFSPTFQLHDLKQTGEYEITTRWTMTMQFNPTHGTPIRNFWDPKLVFTGVSIMGVNPENGGYAYLLTAYELQVFVSKRCNIDTYQSGSEYAKAAPQQASHFLTVMLYQKSWQYGGL